MDIDEPTLLKIKVMHQDRENSYEEICNILNLSKKTFKASLTKLYKRGEIKRRGLKKYTPEQEADIAYEYYVEKKTLTQLKEKWGIHPMQLQEIRNTFYGQYDRKRNGRIRAVAMYSKTGQFLKLYDSLVEASIDNNLKQNSISKNCNNKSKTCGGFIFKHADGLDKRELEYQNFANYL